MKYYEQLDKAITRLEQCKYCDHTFDWCADRVDWCWKWRKITAAQKDELCERIIALYERKI